MADQEILFPQWRDGNLHINFPFSDIATLVNTAGNVVDKDLFDDARLYPIGAAAGMFLSEIEITATQMIFHVADPVNGELAKGGFPLAGPVPDNIALADEFGRPAGVLVSSAQRLITAAGAYPVGITLFEQGETEFAPIVAVPLPDNGLRGVLLDDGSVLASDVYLVGSDGVVLTEENGAIRVDIIGDPYAFQKACAAEGFPVPVFCGLKTINNIRPDSNGDFKITIGGNLSPENILRVLQSPGSVQIAAAVQGL